MYSLLSQILSGFKEPKNWGFSGIVILVLFLLWANVKSDTTTAKNDARFARDTTQHYEKQLSKVSGQLEMLILLKRIEMGIVEMPVDTLVDTVYVKYPNLDSL